MFNFNEQETKTLIDLLKTEIIEVKDLILKSSDKDELNRHLEICEEILSKLNK